MRVSVKRIRNAGRYLRLVEAGANFKLVYRLSPNNQQVCLRVGFPEKLNNGDSVLPSVVGSVTQYNADGKFNMRKDLPKEYRYVNTVMWRWEQWSGYGSTEEMEEPKAIYKNCYQRDFLPPPSNEFSYLEIDGAAYIVSEELQNESSNLSSICHVMNLFLESFGEFEILRTDLTAFQPPISKRVNWDFLPPGEYPWDRVKPHLQRTLKKPDTAFGEAIFDRHETIQRFGPTEVYVGRGGFERYVGYVFSDKNLIVLECTEKDNAIYVFGNNWRQFSQLTKAQILSKNYHVARIIHSNGWKRRLYEVLGQASQAA